jgi:hypothetical protein
VLGHSGHSYGIFRDATDNRSNTHLGETTALPSEMQSGKWSDELVVRTADPAGHIAAKVVGKAA